MRPAGRTRSTGRASAHTRPGSARQAAASHRGGSGTQPGSAPATAPAGAHDAPCIPHRDAAAFIARRDRGIEPFAGRAGRGVGVSTTPLGSPSDETNLPKHNRCWPPARLTQGRRADAGATEVPQLLPDGAAGRRRGPGAGPPCRGAGGWSARPHAPPGRRPPDQSPALR